MILVPDDYDCGSLHLAEHLSIPNVPLSSFKNDAPEAVMTLMGTCQNEFSAVTICDGRRRLIVYNDAHHLNRQRADISHEISHTLLGHPPMPPLNEKGIRNHDQHLEDEANWMGPALLVSEEGAIFIVRNGLTLDDASEYFGVSKEVARMRLNVTGASNRVRKFQR